MSPTIDLFDITSKDVATTRDLLELQDPAAYAKAHKGVRLGSLDEVFALSVESEDKALQLRLLAPCDLQAVKACGVTFARSMIDHLDQRPQF